MNPNDSTPWNDPGASRPYFPKFPTLATAGTRSGTGGTGSGTGGTSITGLNGALIRQVVFQPGTSTSLAAVMDFGTGGRAIGSVDSGETWFTLYDIGGATIEWWNGATPGTQWIVQGSAGATILATYDGQTHKFPMRRSSVIRAVSRRRR